MKRALFIFISIPLLLFGAASLVYAQETSDYSKLTTEDYTNISLPHSTFCSKMPKEDRSMNWPV